MTPKDLDYLKWKIDLADGFRHIESMHDVECPDQLYIAEGMIETHKVRGPLLLQRAIEGVNRVNQETNIVQKYDHILVMWMEDKIKFSAHLVAYGTDGAKAAALKYVYENEVKL